VGSLSNGFSRKLANHAAAPALNYFAYNFIKIHPTLRRSPAMAAGVTDRLWSVEDLVAFWEASAQPRAERAAQVKHTRLMLRILIALAFSAIGFAVGLYLPLWIYMLIHGDPGMPGGAGLVILGFPLGLIGAVVAGLLSFFKFPVR
jgi:hypothetical protein